MAGESVDENIYLVTTFGFGVQKRFQKPPLVIAERCGKLEKDNEVEPKIDMDSDRIYSC